MGNGNRGKGKSNEVYEAVSSRTRSGANRMVNYTDQEEQSIHSRDATSEIFEVISNHSHRTVIPQVCEKCMNPGTDRMIKCDQCEKLFHYNCVNFDRFVQGSEWKCENCVSPTRSNKTKSTTSQENAEIALAKLNARKELRDKIAKEKFQLEEEKIRLKAEYLKTLEENEEKFIEERFEILISKSDYQSVRNASLNRVQDWVNAASNVSQSSQHGSVFSRRNDGDSRKSISVRNLDENKPLQGAIPKSYRAVSRQRSHFEIPEDSYNKEHAPILGKFAKYGDTRRLTDSQLAARIQNQQLPKFSGASGEWLIFYNAFKRTTKRCGYSDEENIDRLEKALTGEARKLVNARLQNSKAVSSIIETLHMNFGNTHAILEDLSDTIERYPKITNEKLNLLVRFSALVEEVCATVENSVDEEESNTYGLLKQMVQKLPTNYELDWNLYKVKNRPTTVFTFREWLAPIARGACHLSKSNKIQTTEPKSFKAKGRIMHTLASHDANPENDKNVSTSNKDLEQPKMCIVCKELSHPLENCKVFLNMSRYERWTIVNRKRLCRTCLQYHFKKCSVTKCCGVDGCTKYHHRLLHDSNPNKIQEKPTINEPIKINHHNSCRSTIYRIVPVYLYGNGVKTLSYAFVDEGSSLTLLEEDTARQLKIDGPPSHLCLKWTGDISRVEENSKMVSLEISSVMPDCKKYRLNGISTVKELNLPIQTLSAEMIDKWEHLQGLDITYYENCQPSLIIGLDYYKLMVPQKTRSGNWDQPIAVKTELGWTVYGPNTEKPIDVRVHFHKCDCSNESYEILHDQVENFFSLESFGVRAGPVLESKEDQRSKMIMQETTRQLGDRYEVGLLWKFDNICLPDSLKMAKKRLVCFENKLLKDPDLLSTVNEKIDDYVAKNYAVKLGKDEQQQGPKTWYIPMFCVQNPNKVVKKTRLVWDAAAKSNGVSLNDTLMKGPDEMAPLLAVLFKFREKQIAISGDIREMFHQVIIREEDRDAQRFLWRRCDQSVEPDVYVLRVMSFGATCSPSLAQHVKNTNAQKFIGEYPRAVSAIQFNHYVDDWLDSFDTTDEAIEITQQVKNIHAAGGFEIRNWQSNDEVVLKSLGQVPPQENKNINEFQVFADKVLGMWWKCDQDQIIFRVNTTRIDINILNGLKRPTKRQILSIIMSVFDPIGLLSPFIVQGKIVLQSVWKSGVDWDEEIGEADFTQWKAWGQQLLEIENLEIPRAYLPFVPEDHNPNKHMR